MDIFQRLQTKYSLRPTRLLVVGSNAIVFEAIHSFPDYTCAVKLQTIKYGFAQAQKEAEALSRLQHENVVRLYGWFWEEEGEVGYLGLVTEKFEMDLMSEIGNRARNRYMWGEDQMWYYIRCLVDACAHMQAQTIAHRDIQPHNILLTPQKAPKIGNFCYFKYIYFTTAHTVTGTPIYLSPLLRQGAISLTRTIRHNVYKSDVYSLGLTFLHMAKLSPPTCAMLGDTHMRVKALQQAIGAIPYSKTMQDFLIWMLAD